MLVTFEFIVWLAVMLAIGVCGIAVLIWAASIPAALKGDEHDREG